MSKVVRKFLRSKTSRRKRSSRTPVDWQLAPDVKARVEKLVALAQLDWVVTAKIFCIRSTQSTARAYARIWGLNRVWQLVLSEKPSYVIEVLAQNFDKLSQHEQDKVLLHELAHIPKTFSGSLMPHYRRGNNKFHDKVDEFYRQYKRNL